MTEAPTESAGDLKALRERAKSLGIKNYQVKGFNKLQTEVFAKIDADAAEGAIEAKEEAIKKAEKKIANKSAEPAFMDEKFYFTNKLTGKIGEYIHLDKKNSLPITAKKHAYKFLRWM